MKTLFKIILSITIVSMFIFGCAGSKTNLEEEIPAYEEYATQTAQEQVVPETVEAPPPPAKPVRPTRFQTIYFDYDQFQLTAEARAMLAMHADKLQQFPDMNIMIEGHCDERGTIEYNLALGDKRANMVKEYLVNYGISASRISIISYGKERPAAQGSTESAWAKNRRAQFRIIR